MPKSTAVKLPCSACAQKFASMTDLNDHYKNVHKGNFRPRRCPDCRKIFVDEAGLKVHRKNYHSDADKGEKVVFSCTSCAYTSKFKGNFKRHMRTVHRVRDNENLIVTGDKELHDKVDDPIEEGENAETSEYEREVSDPVLDAMNDKIEELMRRLPELYPGEQKKLNNLLERRLRWKEELMKHPEFEEQQVKQKQGRKRQKKRCAEETGARKSARLSKEQVSRCPTISYLVANSSLQKPLLHLKGTCPGVCINLMCCLTRLHQHLNTLPQISHLFSPSTLLTTSSTRNLLII